MADMTAGILAVGLRRARKSANVDYIGTNAEIAVGNREWTIACSASAGPAFEGFRCEKHGMKAIHEPLNGWKSISKVQFNTGPARRMS